MGSSKFDLDDLKTLADLLEPIIRDVIRPEIDRLEKAIEESRASDRQETKARFEALEERVGKQERGNKFAFLIWSGVALVGGTAGVPLIKLGLKIVGLL